jgi:hypothetical protein
MAVLRKITLSLLLVAAAGALVIAAWELSNYRQWAYLPAPLYSTGGTRILQARMDLLTRHIGAMELLVLILLVTSGLYAIVLVVSSYFTSTTFVRQADQTVSHMQDQIGLAMGDLRELQEVTEQRLSQMTATATAPAATVPAWETQIAEIAARLAVWQDRPVSEHARLELMQDESTAAYLEIAAGLRASSSLAGLYLGFGRIYASPDSARSRFYLERALRLAAPESAVASEIHYQLACRYAASHAFPHAMRELTAAFDHQFRSLEEQLASDIEEGGKLYDLASTPPFDKGVNDLLLNMSIGIG